MYHTFLDNMTAPTWFIPVCLCVVGLTSGCDRHKFKTEQHNQGTDARAVEPLADWFIQVYYGGKLAVIEGRSTKPLTTNLISPNELVRHVPKGTNRVAIIEVPFERILKDGVDEIWLTTQFVLEEMHGLGFRRAIVESHRWGQTQIITNVMFSLK